MPLRRKKQQAEDGPPGAPAWIVTFTDMISLLVTFFVLLLTFSSFSEFDFMKIDAWLGNTGGIVDSQSHVLINELSEDLLASRDLMRGANQPHSRPQERLLENIEEMGQRLTDEHIQADLSEVLDGMVIEFGVDSCFEPGSIVVPSELRKSLGELARVLENYPFLVVVEGFTDDAFRRTPRWRTAEQLSFVRAARAAEVMLEESSVAPEVLQVAGLGAEHPRADDSTVEGRRLNRRVQVRILSLSKLRAAHLERRSEER
ncbi:MAG: OmpA family protein [Planctomycetota bacterium]|nr:OmpA family protein [Planctomycetota bacterium]